MNIERVNGWLSFAGNIAILLGLIALTIEIRNNTSAVRAEELIAVEEMDRERQLAMAINPELRQLYMKSLFSPSEMTLEELQGMSSYLSYRVNLLQRAYQSYMDGITQQADWEQRLFSVPIYLGNAVGRVWWDVARADYANIPEFVSAVDEAIVNSPVVPDDVWLLELQERIRESGL